MDIDYENYDLKNPFDRIRLEEDRIKRAIAIGKARKARDRSYLKGQRGKRKYVDYNKTGTMIYNDKDPYIYDDDDDDWDYKYIRHDKIKCVFTRDLRREKLYNFFKYLKGRKVLVRNLAWKFAVTERTIQTDIKYLVDKGFITVKTNKNLKGKQIRNSYIVNKVKEVDLPCENTELNIVVIAKQENDYYVLTKTDYKGKDKEYKSKDHKTINQHTFTFPTIQEQNEEQIDIHSLSTAKELFNEDLSNYFKGHVLTDLDKQRYVYKSCRNKDYDEDDYSPKKVKHYFTLFVLDKTKSIDNHYWLKLSVAPRRLRNKSANKCLKFIKEMCKI